LNAKPRIFGAAALVVLAAAPAAAQRLSVVPNPERVQPLDGAFEPRGGLRIVVSQPANRELHELGESAAEILREAFGLRPALVPEGAGAPLGPAMRLTLVALGRGTSPESYVLEITRGGISLSSPSAAGLFYGLQTLRQMLADAADDASIPAVRIEDSPRFAFRGMRLDTSTARVPVEEIERWIDVGAGLKLNVLHWRLGDASGWGLESKADPSLPASYSQEDARRLVDYARERYVEIVPELPFARFAGFESACAGASCGSSPAALVAEVTDVFPSRLIDLGEGELSDPELWRNLRAELSARGRAALAARTGAQAAAAARQGSDVVVAGNDRGPALADVYAFEPVAADLGAVEAKHVRGAEALVGGTPAVSVELQAVAEALWTPAARRDFADFQARARSGEGSAGSASAPTPP